MSRLVIALIASLTYACSSNANVERERDHPSTPPSTPPSTAGQRIDAKVRAAAAKVHHLCTEEIELLCPDGMRNGCNPTDQTTYQVCIRADAKPTSTCDTQVLLECPDGEIDACQTTPPLGARHLCVRY